MKIEEYESPATAIADAYAPRPKASQIAAAAHRAGDTQPLTPIVRNPAPASRLPLAICAVVLVIAMVAMASWQLSRPMQPLTVQPAAAPTSAPAPTAAQPAAAPTSAPAPTAAQPTAAPTSAPVGRGMPVDQVPSDQVPSDQVPSDQVPSDQYIANVGAQAAHSPRGGLCGPTSGDCAPGVPAGIDNNLYIANVGTQAPHKVR